MRCGRRCADVEPNRRTVPELGATIGNQDAMDAFVSVTAGTLSPVEFFDPENIGRIIGAAP